MNDTINLLKRYGRDRDEAAFREVVTGYFDLVHGVALRRLNGDAAAALDVTQMVFTDLARKARALSDDTLLGGWLHSHTCFVATKFIRSETRRTAREKEAAHMNSVKDNGEDVWNGVAPILDEALQQLSAPDRSAIILRYFEGHDLRAVGNFLSVSEDTAQKRVQRALEKLKTLLEARGVSISVTALAALLLSHASPALAAAPIDVVAAKAISEVSTATTGKVLVACIGLILIMGGAYLYGHFENSVPPSQTSVSSGPRAQIEGSVVESSAAASENKSAATDAGPALTLHVVSSATHEPIAGANLRISTSPGPTPLTVQAGDSVFVTDEKGIARVPIREGAARLLMQTWADGYAGWLSIWDSFKGDAIPAEHTVELEPGTPIGGRVIDRDGRPIEGAVVRVNTMLMVGGRDNRNSQRIDVRAVTNITTADGSWAANHIPEALLDHSNIRVSHAQYAATTASVNAGLIPDLRAKTWLVTLEKGLNISGRVITGDGQPVVGATVAHGPQFWTFRKETLTDAAGRYELSNLTTTKVSRAEIVSVAAVNFAAQTQPVTARSSEGELNFVLTAGAVIRGRVQSPDGAPLQGIRVSRESNPPKEDGIAWATETDSEGRFAWTSAPDSPQSFYFGLPGYAQIRNRVLAPGEEHVIVMRKSAVLKGVVKSATTGEAPATFFVAPGHDALAKVNINPGAERPFKNGVFELGLDEGDYTIVQVRAPGFLTANFPMPPEGEPLTAELQPSKTLAGIVLDSTGKPVAGAQVVALGRDNRYSAMLTKGRFVPSQLTADHATSDDAGAFKLPLGVSADRIVASHPAGGFGEMLIPDFESHSELRLAPWGRVEGTLLSGSNPVAGQKVSLQNLAASIRSDYESTIATTDADGRFAFETLPPSHFHLSPITMVGTNRVRPPVQTNILVAPGAVAYIELNIQSGAPRPSP